MSTMQLHPNSRHSTTAIILFFCFGLLACNEPFNPNNTTESEVRLTTANLSPGQVWEPDNYPTKYYPPAPPYIPAPQYACSESVLVTGVLKGAIVQLTINGDPNTTYTKTALNTTATFSVPPLQLHDSLVATQIANGQTSDLSTTRYVEALRTDHLPRPRINKPVWECGRLVGAEGVIPGTLLQLEKNGVYEADVWTTHEWDNQLRGFWPIETPSSLDPVNALMTVQQVYCPQDEKSAVWSSKSDPAPILASPNPLPDFTSLMALEGTTLFDVKGTFFGSLHNYYRESDDDTHNLGWLFAPWEDFAVDLDEVIDPSLGSYMATHELCPGSAPKPKQADIIGHEEVEQMLGEISIREPICPNTTAIQIESNLGGRIAMSYNNNPLFETDIPNGVSTVGVPQGVLQAEGTLKVVQVAQGTENTENIEGAPASATVGAAFGLEMFGAESFVDQNTNETIEGFLRNGEQSSRGPIFELSCCASCTCDDCQLSQDDQCLVNGEPRTATLELDPGNYTVTLYEDFPGHFVGRWDWFVEDPNAAIWPPAATRVKAVLVDSPCNQEEAINVNILVGAPDFTDETQPEFVQLSVKGKTVTTTSNEATIEVNPLESTQINARMRDQEGAKDLIIESSPGGHINAPASKSSNPNIVPIPTELTLNTTLTGPQPYESIKLSAIGSNYSQLGDAYSKAETNSLTVVGKHINPVLSNLSPSTIYSDQSLTLEGDYLAYNTLGTTVRFESPNGVYEVSNFNSTVDTLSNIQLPSALNNYFGEIDVWVVTRYNGQSGAIEKESNRLSLKLINRNNSFQTINGLAFHSEIAPSLTACNSNTAPGGVSNITIEDAGPLSLYEARAIIHSNGRSNPIKVEFNVASTGPNGAPSLGGVALFNNSCRVVAIMSHISGSMPAKFVLHLIYFPSDSSQRPTFHKLEPVGFHYYNGTSNQYAPYAFAIMANAGDGSVIGVGYPDSVSAWSTVRIFAEIHDMLRPDDSTGSKRTGNASACSGNCDYTMNINNHEVNLLVDDSVFVNWILGN